MPEINLLGELEKLTEVTSGMTGLLEANSADRWNAVRNMLVGLMNGANLRSGANVRKRNGPGWVMLSANDGGGSSSLAAEEIWPFKAYRSTFTGEGSPPGDQALRFRIRIGKVNWFTPSNISDEFTADASADTYVWLKATISTSTGRPSAIEIETGSDVTATPDPGSAGVPPSVTYRGIAKITASDTAITNIEPLIKDSQWISAIPTLVDADTGTFKLDVIWCGGPAGTAF